MPELNARHLDPELLETPSLARWHALCRDLDRLKGGALVVTLSWLEVRLRDWPARLRPAPLRWVMDALRGSAQPRLCLAGTVVISPSMISRGDWAARLSACPSLGGIEQVWIDGVSVDAWDLEVLSRASWLRRLSVLCLTRCGLSGAEARALGEVLSGAPLTHLSLAGNDLDDHGASRALSRSGGHRVTYLDLRDNPISAPMRAAIERAMPQLRAAVFETP